VVRKLDLRLLPVLATIYAFALIDRVNLPNARIAGMDEDLQLSVGERYSLLSMIFFVPYIIFQFPANIIIRKLGAALWLSSLVVCWGVVSIGMGFTTKWDQLLGCRVLLGILEAGYYPGCIFLLRLSHPSAWLCRRPLTCLPAAGIFVSKSKSASVPSTSSLFSPLDSQTFSPMA